MTASLILQLTPPRILSEYTMVKAILDNIVIAETDDYEVVEGNKYFPPESLKKDYFSDSNTECVGLSFPERATDLISCRSTCPWKG